MSRSTAQLAVSSRDITSWLVQIALQVSNLLQQSHLAQKHDGAPSIKASLSSEFHRLQILATPGSKLSQCVRPLEGVLSTVLTLSIAALECIVENSDVRMTLLSKDQMACGSLTSNAVDVRADAVVQCLLATHATLIADSEQRKALRTRLNGHRGLISVLSKQAEQLRDQLRILERQSSSPLSTLHSYNSANEQDATSKAGVPSHDAAGASQERHKEGADFLDRDRASGRLRQSFASLRRDWRNTRDEWTDFANGAIRELQTLRSVCSQVAEDVPAQSNGSTLRGNALKLSIVLRQDRDRKTRLKSQLRSTQERIAMRLEDNATRERRHFAYLRNQRLLLKSRHRTRCKELESSYRNFVSEIVKKLDQKTESKMSEMQNKIDVETVRVRADHRKAMEALQDKRAESKFSSSTAADSLRDEETALRGELESVATRNLSSLHRFFHRHMLFLQWYGANGLLELLLLDNCIMLDSFGFGMHHQCRRDSEKLRRQNEKEHRRTQLKGEVAKTQKEIGELKQRVQGYKHKVKTLETEFQEADIAMRERALALKQEDAALDAQLAARAKKMREKQQRVRQKLLRKTASSPALQVRRGAPRQGPSRSARPQTGHAERAHSNSGTGDRKRRPKSAGGPTFGLRYFRDPRFRDPADVDDTS